MSESFDVDDRTIHAMTPEQVGMLNGRMAALHAATADLLERGILVADENHGLRVAPSEERVTPLQDAVLRTVRDAPRGTQPDLGKDDRVIAQLDVLQREAVARGLLKPPRHRTTESVVRGVVLSVILCVFWWIALTGLVEGGAGSGESLIDKVFPLFFVLIAALVTALLVPKLFHLFRPDERQRRTPNGIEVLEQLRGQTPQPVSLRKDDSGLGRAVGLYGTRPLLLAFPAAAGIGWALTDIGDPREELHRTSALGSSDGGIGAGDDGSSGGSGDAWCSGGSTCGAGGSCSSGSCGGGSGCGGGGSCSS